jgi:tRNA uridine 5-carboxymethylaminomethyl modification enzyme
MFTSRAENRISLREDNADLRLYEFAKENNLIDERTYLDIRSKWEKINSAVDLLDKINIKPSASVNERLEKINSSTIKQQLSAKDLLKRPELSFKDILDITGDEDLKKFDIYAEEIEIEIKYEGYIKIQDNKLDTDELDSIFLSLDTDYNKLENLSKEVREKLNKVKPRTVGQALRIPGITHAAVDSLLIYKKRGLI